MDFLKKSALKPGQLAPTSVSLCTNYIANVKAYTQSEKGREHIHKADVEHELAVSHGGATTWRNLRVEVLCLAE